MSSSDGSGPATLNGVAHWVQLGTTPVFVRPGELDGRSIASNIASQIAANDTRCTATASGNAITISLRRGTGGAGGGVEFRWISRRDAERRHALGDHREATYSCDLKDRSRTRASRRNIAAQITADDPNCTATAGGLPGNEITITLRAGIVGPVSVSSSDGSASAYA